ncbi:phenylacetate--CoA ligase family protein [Luedemannella helvata]|uniref:Phenylacetate--CoA ligase family protein n=1 Tax=Luedemannella helvata TaxID=349315 RepID=A0ABP4VXC3_9ACTN
MQARQLPLALRRAAASPFYRRRLGPALPRDRAGLADTPLTTKQDLRDSYPFGMLAVPRNRLATYHESSGTTGVPTASYYTDGDWTDLAQRYARKWTGIGPADTFLVRTPYALMITGHLAHAAARMCGATVVPADNRTTAMPYARVVRALHDLDVTLTWSLPTEPLLWAAAARLAGLRPDRDFPSLRALFVGGEPLSRARRDRIAEIWGVPVVEEYGSTETGSLAGQCPRGRLHLWADRAIFEVYDPGTGRIGPDGCGQLVVTPLYREAMPLLRYNIEDDVEVRYESCGCGWALPTVRVLGRSASGHAVGPATVTQARLEELVFALPVRYEVMFWRASAQPHQLRVEIEVPAGHRDAACAELAAAVRAEYGIEVRVDPVEPGGLVSRDALTATADVVKPRGLFGPDEDWDRALRYY